MSLTLYAHPICAPCRMTVMTLEIIGKPYEYKTVDIRNGEQRSPEYLKINPAGLVPSFFDGEFCLTESRAIAIYIATVYGKETSLFPEDEKVRGVITSRIMYEMGTFYKAFGDIVYPIMFDGVKEISDAKLNNFKKTLKQFEDFVTPTGFVAGTKDISVADIVFLSGFSNIVQCNVLETMFDDYPGLKTWFETCKSKVPNFDTCNFQGATMFGDWFKSVYQNSK